MKALTLWRPWAWAIISAGKDIENRTWAPPQSVIGQRIAIHAGRTLDAEAAEQIAGLLGLEALPPRSRDEGVIGSAIVTDIVLPSHTFTSESPWFAGPIGWLLADPVALPKPIPCRGAQGLWDLPAEIEAEIRRSLPEGLR